MRPTAEDLEDARRLKIEGAEHMTGPELREAIRRARARVRNMRAGRQEYARLRVLCEQLGAKFQAGAGNPSLRELRRFYHEELPLALAREGIVEGAYLTIPAGTRLAASGRARVGKLSHNKGWIVITLAFEGGVHAYDAALVWRHAMEVRPPKSWRAPN